MSGITAVVIAKNEAKRIGDCLESLAWCDEIIVIDDYSSDNTVEIAERKARVIRSHLEGDFANQRNRALEHAKNEWVFFVDADEIVPPALHDEIKASIKSTDAAGFLIRRIDVLWGKPLLHGETGAIKLLRLAKKDSGRWIGKVHEVWQTNGSVRELKNPMLHKPHEDIKDFLVSINEYTDIRAGELFERGVTANFFTVIAYPKGKFFYNFFIRLGILDGVRGLIHALLMSFHSFLVRAKLYLLNHEKVIEKN